MVLHKWAALVRSPPPFRGILPKPRTIPTHPRLKPAAYKIPYVLRSYVKDSYTAQVQHLENRGMYKEEISIERSRFPRLSKTLVIQTDGSMNEREFEFTVPPMVILFQDRLAAHRQRQAALAKIGKLRREKSWEAAAMSAVEKGNESAAADEGAAAGGNRFGTPSESLLCNALTFPYCVPKHLIRREKMVDPLVTKKSK